MKNSIIVGSIIILIFVVGYVSFWRHPEIKNTPPKNDTIVIFGDSLVEGVGSTAGNDLVSVLQRGSDKKFINYGKSGDTTRDARDRTVDVLAEHAGVVIIILGGNDVLQKIPKEETFVHLETMITTFQDDGSAVILVGVRSGVVGNGRDADYKALADKTGALYVSDILKDVFAKRQYMSDAVHPNDAGYALIAERFMPIIASLFK